MNAAMSLGIVCFPSFGGSGVVATEVALGFARKGHSIHLISTAPPFRLSQEARPEEPPPMWREGTQEHCVRTSLYRLPPRPTSGEILFHQVKLPSYPLFQEAPYTLALASALAEVSLRAKLDLLHLHYAIPHAVSGYLAKQMLGHKAPRLVVTLHGTDVTHVGPEPSYKYVTKMALSSYDGLGVPSHYLREAAYQKLGLAKEQPIEILSNFVDTERFCPPPAPPISPSKGFEIPALIHISNFRPIKRVLDAVDVFLKVSRHRKIRLLMIGDGPDRPAAEAKIREAGYSDQALFLGNTPHLIQSLQKSSLLLLPSEMESFGLVALEALSCGVPVLASRVGGLPEVVRDGETGFLTPLGDSDAMAARALELLEEPRRWEEFSKKARLDVLLHWSQDAALRHYEAYYRRLIEHPSVSSDFSDKPLCDHPACTFHC